MQTHRPAHERADTHTARLNDYWFFFLHSEWISDRLYFRRFSPTARNERRQRVQSKYLFMNAMNLSDIILQLLFIIVAPSAMMTPHQSRAIQEEMNMKIHRYIFRKWKCYRSLWQSINPFCFSFWNVLEKNAKYFPLTACDIIYVKNASLNFWVSTSLSECRRCFGSLNWKYLFYLANHMSHILNHLFCVVLGQHFWWKDRQKTDRKINGLFWL